MKATAILLPALVLMLWTFLVLLQIPIRRFAAYFSKRVGADDFNYGESSNVPADVALKFTTPLAILKVAARVEGT